MLEWPFIGCFPVEMIAVFGDGGAPLRRYSAWGEAPAFAEV